ncbi:MAG: 50S ribosomal protein L18 [Gemmataceae bacterium]
MNSQKLKAVRRTRRANRVRNKVRGTAERPRLTVFRSSKHISAQLIDDDKGVTLASATSLVPKAERAAAGYGGNVKAAKAIGLKLAEAAKAKGIALAAFDRGFYRYHGRIKALADGAREGGLQF